jgi:hypothetical protein
MSDIHIIKPPILEQAPRNKESPSTATWSGYRTFGKDTIRVNRYDTGLGDSGDAGLWSDVVAMWADVSRGS